MSLKDLRSNISIIPQFGFLYRASLKDNVDPEGKHSSEMLKETLEKVGLDIKGAKSESSDERLLTTEVLDDQFD
jgi:ABC-type multidrug transport system fused ATPase/permease subunit